MAAGLQELVADLTAVLRRGVKVDDAHGRLLAYSAQGADVDAARVQAILGALQRPGGPGLGGPLRAGTRWAA